MRLEVAREVALVREARAGRLLLHSLLAQCAEAGLRLVPPQVLTPWRGV